MAEFKQLGVAADHVTRNPAMRQEVLNVHPNAKFHDIQHRMKEDELIEFLKDCDAAIIGFEPVTDRVLSALPNLKLISKYGNGCETFDFEAMKRHNVRFGYTWGVNKLAVAELTLGFMLMGLRWVMPLNVAMRAGERPGIRNGRFLTGRVVGIHGCGNIGKEVVRLLAAVQLQDPRLRRQGLRRLLQTVERDAGVARRAARTLRGAHAASAEDQADARPLLARAA